MTELGNDTRDVAADVVCVTGGVVSMAGNGVPFVMSAVTSFVLEPDTEDRTLLVMEVNTLLVPREEGLCVPEARVSVSVTEDVSMRVPCRDSVRWSVVGFSVVFPVDVTTAGLGEGC